MQAGQQATLSVCTRCRGQDDPPEAMARPGYRLAQLIKSRFPSSEEAPQGLALRGIRCMSQCKRPCVVALSGPGKYTLVFGDLDASTDADAILQLAGQYAASADGLIQRADRPEPLRAGILGRIPPLCHDGDPIDPDFTISSTLHKETL